MGYCKHQWRERSRVLREVFSFDTERREHGFYVCERCLKIDEVDAPFSVHLEPIDRDQAA